MSRFHKGKEIGAINFIKDGIIHTVLEIRKGVKIVWQAINSCFGSGKWDNHQPWNNNEGWKN